MALPYDIGIYSGPIVVRFFIRILYKDSVVLSKSRFAQHGCPGVEVVFRDDPRFGRGAGSQSQDRHGKCQTSVISH